MDLVKAPERTHNVASIDRVENWAAVYTASIAMKVGGLCPCRRLQRWAPGAAMLSVFEERNKHDYRREVRMITDFIRESVRVS
jgi:hypothetical protein